MFALETVDIIVKGSLYAIKYINSYDEFENNKYEDDNSTKNEFRRLFSNWSDPEYLEAFFEANKSDLQKEFYNFISIEDAIEETIEEASLLEEQLIEIAESGNKTNNLQTLFKSLDDREKAIYPIPPHQKSKVYGSYRPSWLRIYAIRIDRNVFVVSGGAIKLVHKMKERQHLRTELDKLELVKHYLIDNDIIDKEDLIEFFEI